MMNSMKMSECFEYPATQKELICLLVHYFGLISPKQLATIMGISYNYLLKLVCELNAKGEYIQKKYPARNRRIRKQGFISGQKYGPRMYMIGSDGIELVEAILKRKAQPKVYATSHMEHTWGTHEILCRVIDQLESDDPLQVIDWWTTANARNLLFTEHGKLYRSEWRADPEKRKKAEEEIIEPDGRLKINGKYLWIEYDNGYEDDKKLKRKYRRYVFTLFPIKNRDPIVWVAPTQERAAQMAAWWEETQNGPAFKQFAEIEGFYFPKMIFTTLDEVGAIILQRPKKNPSAV